MSTSPHDEKQVDVPEHPPSPAGRPGSSIDGGTEPGRDEEKDGSTRSNADALPHEGDEEGEPSAAQEDVEAVRSRSRASSTRSRALSIVPRSKRRGLLGRFSITPEVYRPYDYSNKTKWTLTLVVALAGAGAPLGSSIFYPALPQMAVDLHASTTVTNMSVAFYMLSMSIFPLWWSSFSEIYGRRSIYVVSFTLMVVFSVASAVSTNVAMLIVFRMLGGGASASVQAVGAGTIADLWEPRERGNAMSLFYLGPLLGPLLAPIIGGALAQAFGWQATMWCLAIYGGLILLMIFFLLPETLPRRKPTPPPDGQTGPGAAGADAGAEALARTRTAASAVSVHTKRAAKFIKKAIIDPLQILLMLRFPPVAITVYYAAITFGSLFALNISIQTAFSQKPYYFSVMITGLMYTPSALGYFLASAFGGRWIDRIMAREAEKAGRYNAQGKLVYLPEDRLRENAWIAGTVYPLSLLLYGWTVQHGLFWFVPCIGLFAFGSSSMLVFSAATTMLTEFMPKRSSAGVAANNFVRNIFSCTFAVVSQPIISAIGHGWLFTILAIVSLTTGYMCIWSMRRFGPVWRKKMDEKLNG